MALHAPSFEHFISSLNLLLSQLPRGVWAVHFYVWLFIFRLKTTFTDDTSIEAMDFVKQPDSQVAAELHAPRRGVSTSSTATALASEELELIRRHAASTKEASPTKKAGTEPGWEEFLSCSLCQVCCTL